MNLKLKDMFKFAGDKKSKYPYIHFSKGNVYATNGRVCLISLMDYPELYECSTRDKKFEYITDATFPNCDNLLLATDKRQKISYSKSFFKRALDFYNEHKDLIRKELFEVQIRISDEKSFYIGVDVLKSICDYLSFFPSAELYIPTSTLQKQLQFESYKGDDSIFESDSKEVQSSFIFISDKLNKSSQTIYTYDDKLYIAEDSTYNTFYKGLIERSNLENYGFIDLDYIRAYFTKYGLPDPFKFRDNILSALDNRTILDIVRFDDYLHEKYGDYDKELIWDNDKQCHVKQTPISMNDMFDKLFGKDAKIMASFFGVDNKF